MPELPEVETVRRGLEGALAGATIARVTLRRAGLRIPFPEGMEKQLTGRRINAIRRRAKYLIFELSDGIAILSHLGMSGQFSVVKPLPESFAKHDHLVMELTDGRTVLYNDARRFGLITLVPQEELAAHPLLADLGPEPLEKVFSAKYLGAALGSRKGPVKVAIMDQTLVVGVGNIYASEALFLAGIHPQMPAYQAAGQAGPLVKAIQKVLRDAIASGGSSLKDFIHVSGEAGYFQHHFNVYGRGGKPCYTCGTTLKTMRLGGRSTFFCAQCQT